MQEFLSDAATDETNFPTASYFIDTPGSIVRPLPSKPAPVISHGTSGATPRIITRRDGAACPWGVGHPANGDVRLRLQINVCHGRTYPAVIRVRPAGPHMCNFTAAPGRVAASTLRRVDIRDVRSKLTDSRFCRPLVIED